MSGLYDFTTAGTGGGLGGRGRAGLLVGERIEPLRLVERHDEDVVAVVRVADVRERLAVGRGLRLVRAVDHVGDLLQHPGLDLVRVDVRDARAVRVEIEPSPVGRVRRVAVDRAIVGDVEDGEVLRVDDAHVAIAAAPPGAVRDVPVVG